MLYYYYSTYSFILAQLFNTGRSANLLRWSKDEGNNSTIYITHIIILIILLLYI